MIPCAVFDIDDTLADARWRDNLLPPQGLWTDPNAWHRYHLASRNDQPILENITLLRTLRKAGSKIVLSTSRPLRWMALTEAWLQTNGCSLDNIFLMLMRSNDDLSPTAQLKVGHVGSLALKGLRVDYVFDDHPEVCAALSSLGFNVMQVRRKS